MSGTKSNPVTQFLMGFKPKSDPIPKVEKRASNAELKGTDRILNNGEALFMQGSDTLIFNPNATERDKQIQNNESNGLGSFTNVEAAIMMETSFYEEYDDWDSEWEEDYTNWVYVAPDEQGYGGYWDTGSSCYFGSDNGASFEPEGEELTAEEPQLTPEQQAFLDVNTIEPQGELTTAFSVAADPTQEELPTPAVAANAPTYAAPALRA